jgi:hypothetical protein
MRQCATTSLLLHRDRSDHGRPQEAASPSPSDDGMTTPTCGVNVERSALHGSFTAQGLPALEPSTSVGCESSALQSSFTLQSLPSLKPPTEPQGLPTALHQGRPWWFLFSRDCNAEWGFTPEDNPTRLPWNSHTNYDLEEAARRFLALDHLKWRFSFPSASSPMLKSVVPMATLAASLRAPASVSQATERVYENLWST